MIICKFNRRNYLHALIHTETSTDTTSGAGSTTAKPKAKVVRRIVKTKKKQQNQLRSQWMLRTTNGMLEVIPSGGKRIRLIGSIGLGPHIQDGRNTKEVTRAPKLLPRQPLPQNLLWVRPPVEVRLWNLPRYRSS